MTTVDVYIRKADRVDAAREALNEFVASAAVEV
jgi:hypothetical protein